MIENLDSAGDAGTMEDNPPKGGMGGI